MSSNQLHHQDRVATLQTHTDASQLTRLTQTGLPETQPEDPNPFLCNVCKKSYSRIDHLARHYRAHTNEKPFPCHICDKDFARADLLKRHVDAHDDDKDRRKKQKTEATPTRPRVAQACIACAEAKLKCESKKPCRRCQQKQIECEYPPPKARRATLASRSDSLADTQSSLQQNDSSGTAQTITALIENNTNQRSGLTPPPNDTAEQAEFTDMARRGSNSQLHMEQFQMITPMTFMQDPMPSGDIGDDLLTSFDNSSLADFLRDIMMPSSPNFNVQDYTFDPNSQTFSPRDVLNFGVESTFDLPDFDSSVPLPNTEPLLQAAPIAQVRFDNYMQNNRSGTRTPVVSSGINLGAQAFRDSLWQWTPAQQDHGYAEQLNLSLPSEEMNLAKVHTTADGRPMAAQVQQSSRDRILAMILTTCTPSKFAKIVASFPSTELLTNLLHSFVSFHASQADSWVHLSTLQTNELRAELLAIMIATGAVLSGIPIIRKLGFAIQEAVRLAVPEIFESDNSATRELEILQTYALQLDIGLWSGDRRKMEMAESFAHPLITMLRRAGHFRQRKRPFVPPNLEDDTASLEAKWHNWVELESFKRLAFHLLIRDVQTSMCLLTPPLISYAEFSVEMPLSRELWSATNATDWKNIYLDKISGLDQQIPSLPRCIHDITPLSKVNQAVDVKMAILVVLYGIWTLIWEYRQLNTVMKLHPTTTPWNSGLITTSLHQEVCQLLSHFNMTASEWSTEGAGEIQVEATLVYERSLMSLHVSFEDLQLFAGKEGEDEARRVYPLLAAWAEGRESRQAVWHAGQVLRAAKKYRAKDLRDFSAIALYHASMALWAKAVVEQGPVGRKKIDNDGGPEKSAENPGFTGGPGAAKSSTAAQHGKSNPLTDTGSTAGEGTEFVWLDGEDGPALQKYLVLGRGTPAIRRLNTAENNSGTSGGGRQKGSAAVAALKDPWAVMEIAIEILRTKSRGGPGGSEMPMKTWTCPPLVENLSRLMGSLGRAAEGMMR